MRPIDEVEAFQKITNLIENTTNIDALLALRTARTMVALCTRLDVTHVVYCKDCVSCQPLYCKPDGTAASDGSFRCGDTEIEYYAPDYNMETYYCADGKRRDKPCT